MHPDRIGPYHIEKKIGAGGMGNVYLGRHETTGEEAAIKVLPASLAREEGFVLRFNREIEALRKLKHPNIVALFDSGVDGETYFYAMEYVAGETLTNRIRQQKRIPWREAVDYAIQICGALKAAHDAGVIHRDLKPSNLMLAPDGQIKLTDFGVAQVFASTRLTITGGVIGTAEYMSPEQSQGQRANKRSDLYSLGAVLYVMLTGRPPFTGSTTVEIMQKQRFGRFDRAKMYIPDLPSWLDDLVSNLLEKDPDLRPPDAYVLSRKLQEVVAKVDLSQKDERATVVEGHVRLEDTTPSGHLIDAGVGATFMRDLVRDELVRQQTPTGVQSFFNNTWVLAGLLAVVITTIAWFSLGRKMTPDEQFQAGAELMQRAPGQDWLLARDRYFLPLMQADPEQWKEDVQPYLDEIEAFELESSLTPPRTRGKVRQLRSEPERMLALVRADWERGDYAAADRRLTALSNVLDGHETDKALRTVVESWQAALRDQQGTSPDRRAYVESLVTQAESIQHADPAAARRIAAGVIELYAHDATVDDLVTRARQISDATAKSAP